ncbi:MAG TPA: sucrase ferredoxin [Pyrinomonadaceae bacterium]|nr:sucrase ferredoxin [Pyrinomonadaceae bacterium]
MVQQDFYCSQLSRGVEENTFGTASVGEVWLLVEYTEPWGPHALKDSSLSTEVKNYLNQLIRRIPRSRLLFIKQERRHQSRFNFFIVRGRERNPFIVRFELDDYEKLRERYLDVASVAAGEKTGHGEVVTEPLYLVCTHGKRDKCCAKFGFPIYKSVREARDGQVWQSSHVGGDRFAANLLCFPHGLFYAHVTDESAHEVVEAYEREQIVLEKFRGRACYPYPVQAADYFIRRETGVVGVNELRGLSSERVDDDCWRIRFGASDAKEIHEAVIRRRLSAFNNFITCSDVERKQVVQFYLEDYSRSHV